MRLSREFILALLIATGGAGLGCATVETGSREIPAVVVEEASAPDASGKNELEALAASRLKTSGPIAPEQLRELRSTQRKQDDERILRKYPSLKFTSDSERAVHYFSLGQAYSLNGEVEPAIEAYRKALVYDSESALLRARLAAELVKVGNLSEAKAHCLLAIAADPKFIDAHLLLAGIEVVSKELGEALLTYEKVLKIDPEHRDALLYYGTTLADAGRLPKAAEVLKGLVKLDDSPSSQIDKAIAWFYLAKVETQMDKFDDAAFSLKQALKERPGFAKAALFLADIYLAQEKQGLSIAVLEEAYQESAHPSIAARLAAFYMSDSQFAKAVPFLETVVESDEGNVSAKVRLALVYWQIQWHGKAATILEEIHRQYPQSSEITYYLGELELERDRPKEAFAYFKKISPDYARYEDAVGRAVASLQALNQLEAAKNFLSAAIKRKPKIVGFYTALARIFEQESKFHHAVKVLEGNRSRIEADENALYYLGYLYDRVGDKSRGAEIMAKILEKNPDNANALNYLGYSLLEEGKDLVTAEKKILRAVELKPNDPYILDSYGWLLFKQGNAAAALRQLERARELKPDEGVIIEHLADAYLKLNMKKKALVAYEEALELLTDPKDQSRVGGKIDAISGDRGQTPRLPASN
jgi:tetratricopeptide (TPR) repeat protein